MSFGRLPIRMVVAIVVVAVPPTSLQIEEQEGKQSNIFQSSTPDDTQPTYSEIEGVSGCCTPHCGTQLWRHVPIGRGRSSALHGHVVCTSASGQPRSMKVPYLLGEWGPKRDFKLGWIRRSAYNVWRCAQLKISARRCTEGSHSSS